MKALHIIAPGPMAGAERVVAAGIEALSATCEPSVVVLADARASADAEAFAEACRPHAPVRRVVLTSAFDVGALAAIRNERWLASPDVLHVHGYKALGYGIAAAGTTPLVATLHGETHATPQVRRYELAARRVYAACARVFLVSEAQRSPLRSAGVEDARMQHIPNPLTRSIPRRQPRTLGAPLRLLSLGRLSPEKGVRDLIEALASCRGLSWVLDVVGDGPDRGALESLALRRDVGDRVAFHGFRSDIAPFLAQADALVMLSHREGMPLTAIEAACAGIPMILSEVGALPDLFGAHPAVSLIAPRDPSAFLDALHGLDASISERRESAEAASEAWRRRFDVRTWATRTLKAYQAVCAEPPRSVTDRLARGVSAPFFRGLWPPRWLERSVSPHPAGTR